MNILSVSTQDPKSVDVGNPAKAVDGVEGDATPNFSEVFGKHLLPNQILGRDAAPQTTESDQASEVASDEIAVSKEDEVAKPVLSPKETTDDGTAPVEVTTKHRASQETAVATPETVPLVNSKTVQSERDSQISTPLAKDDAATAKTDQLVVQNIGLQLPDKERQLVETSLKLGSINELSSQSFSKPETKITYTEPEGKLEEKRLLQPRERPDQAPSLEARTTTTDKTVAGASFNSQANSSGATNSHSLQARSTIAQLNSEHQILNLSSEDDPAIPKVSTEAKQPVPAASNLNQSTAQNLVQPVKNPGTFVKTPTFNSATETKLRMGEPSLTPLFSAIGDPEYVSVEPRVSFQQPMAPGQSSLPSLPRHTMIQIADAVRGSGNKPVEIALNPDELGRVRLSVSASDGGVIIQVLAERSETLDLLRRNSSELSRELAQHGFDNLNLSFGAGQSSDRSDSQPKTTAAEDDDVLSISMHSQPAFQRSSDILTEASLDIRL